MNCFACDCGDRWGRPDGLGAFFDLSSFGSFMESGFGNILTGALKTAVNIGVSVGVGQLVGQTTQQQQAPANPFAIGQQSQYLGVPTWNTTPTTAPSGSQTPGGGTSVPVTGSGSNGQVIPTQPGAVGTMADAQTQAQLAALAAELEAQKKTPDWVLPVAVGGGVLLLLVVVMAARR